HSIPVGVALRTSDAGLLPPVAGSVLLFLGGFAPPSFITIPRAILRGGMSIKEVADILTELVGESPNLFGKLDRTRRKDWIKNLKKFWHVGDVKGLLIKGDQEGLSVSHRVHLETLGFLPKVIEPNFTFSTKLKARTNSPNDPTCLLSTQFLKFNPASPENKIKTCTSIIKLTPIITMPLG
ncbi:hypothetical protein H5410_021655, partial [Solanum commersonii]